MEGLMKKSRFVVKTIYLSNQMSLAPNTKFPEHSHEIEQITFEASRGGALAPTSPGTRC